MASTFQPMQALSVQASGAEPSEWYESLVLDFTEGRELVIGALMSKGIEVSIRPGTPVLLQLTLPDGLRRFTSTVQGRKASSPPSLALDWPQAEQRIQRREDVRVDIMFNAELRPILPAGSLGPPLHGLVADISAGGARIFTATNLHIGAEVQLTMQLPGIGERSCDARVVRAGLNAAQATKHPHWVGVMFTELSQGLRKEITRLVFDIQRELLRKGMK